MIRNNRVPRLKGLDCLCGKAGAGCQGLADITLAYDALACKCAPDLHDHQKWVWRSKSFAAQDFAFRGANSEGCTVAVSLVCRVNH